MTGVDADLATRERRDAFLRAVIAELQPANRRWPGLWTRLASLLDERDALEAELSRLREDRDWQWDKHIEWHRRAEAAEARCARLQALIAQQLTPLDVAVTHIQILRRKGDDYTAQERDNVAAIVERYASEARSALFEALAGPDTPADSLERLA